MAIRPDISLRDGEFESLSPYLRENLSRLEWLIDEFRTRGFTDCDDKTYMTTMTQINKARALTESEERLPL